jgi:histidinol-phosphate aminotransferase
MTPTTSYQPPAPTLAVDLDLSRNEGRAPRAGLPAWGTAPAAFARYPDLGPLRAALAARHGLAPDRVLVTAGGDDGLLRLCLQALAGGGEAVLPLPTFEMLERYVAMAGGRVVPVDWPDGAFPVDAVLAAVTPRTRLVFVVSPNNPTGAVATVADLERLAAALPGVRLVLDAAYAEFASADLTAVALRWPQVVVVRTLSKAWSLAGLRVGYLLGDATVVASLAAHGNPFPVAGVAAAAALQRLREGADDVADHVASVGAERNRLLAALDELGIAVARPTEGNFVLARGVAAPFVVAALQSFGIAVRHWPERRLLAGAVRIGLPGEPVAFARLERALRAVLAPAAMLFDVDGVLVDVQDSYRATIVETVRSFGAHADTAAVETIKAGGDANDDWAVTHRLLQARGVAVARAMVVERFEGIYRRRRANERALVDVATLRSWRSRFRLGLVTGRPRADVDDAIDRFGWRGVFDTVVSRDDAVAMKPDPAPVRTALANLGVTTAWMLGDTVDDMVAARGAGALPIGVVPPGADSDRTVSLLRGAGACHVLDATTRLPSLWANQP